AKPRPSSINVNNPEGRSSMYQGRSLQALAEEVKRQRAARRDFRAPSRQLVMDRESRVEVAGQGTFEPTPIAHRQIGERIGIPAKYYDRMRIEAPDLLASNVNHWLRESDEKRLVRTLDGNARAFLSDRYRRLDNFELLEAALPTLQQYPDMQV